MPLHNYNSAQILRWVHKLCELLEGRCCHNKVLVYSWFFLLLGLYCA